MVSDLHLVSIIACAGLKQQSQIKNNLWQNHIVSFQYDATMRRCWVIAETNDGCFDAANANKSCVRVHGGQSSEFPIYPTTRERANPDLTQGGGGSGGSSEPPFLRTLLPKIRTPPTAPDVSGHNRFGT